jgi:hypothetical protein
VRVQDNCGDLPFHYAWYQHWCNKDTTWSVPRGN